MAGKLNRKSHIHVQGKIVYFNQFLVQDSFENIDLTFETKHALCSTSFALVEHARFHSDAM